MHFDVVIPTHDASPAQLDAAVRSALSCPSLHRILLIDDGSRVPVRTDGDPRIHIVRQENAGPSAARNRGIELARADAVLFLDDDDELIPSGVEAMAAICDSLGAGAIGAARIEVVGDREILKQWPPQWADRTLPSAGDVFRPLSLFGTSGWMVARRILDKGLRFDESLWIGEDREFLYRVGALGPLAASSAPGIRARVRGSNNLTGPAHYRRRIDDHIAILRRCYNDDTARHLEEATHWLLRAAAKVDVDRADWHRLVDAARLHGWGVPVKAAVRRGLRRMLRT